MKFNSDKSLSEQLEKTEARFNAELVCTRLKMFPNSRAEWIGVNGTYAMYDGIESPLTQTFGLGLFEKLSLQTIEELEKFYHRFSSPIFHEVSPLSDPTHMELLSKCGYQPVELSSVLYKPLPKENPPINPEITTRQMKEGEEQIWARVSAKGWCPGASDISEFLYEFAGLATKSRGVTTFFANLDDKPISTGMLFIDNDIALLAGDSTILEGRGRGAQNALIDARLNYAAKQGCKVAMMATSPGSQSQKNGEKNGFRLAYTRTKWKLRRE